MSPGTRLAFLCATAAVALAAGGCRVSNREYLTPERLDEGLVVSLSGIGGVNWGPAQIREGLDEAGTRRAFVIYDWSQGARGAFLADLVAEKRNKAVAADLAETLAAYTAAYPDRPITVIGHSGGAAVVVWALERMPPGTRVERAFLLAPALAPTYDLSDALRHVGSRLYVAYSYADVGFMAAGTTVFGTMDRSHTVSAGLVGFRLPKGLEKAEKIQYAKVRQIRWDADLLGAGHLGGHMGWTTRGFAREFLAPILEGEADPGRPLVVIRRKQKPAGRAGQTGGRP